MRTLQDEVTDRGFKIVAIKTDSIKIADATKDIIDFCVEFAKRYGYEFEHEATYDRMCQINDADYVAKYKDSEWCEKTYGYIPGDNAKHPGQWTATGARFQVPYVFKKLFSGEPVIFDDLCEAKEVKSAIYLDMNEGLPDVTEPETVRQLRHTQSEQLSRKESKLLELYSVYSDDVLSDNMATGHDYKFVGKVGQFCPIKPGCGGGILVREAKDIDGNIKYDAVTGTKGYRWMESEMVKQLGKESDIDISYYNKLVDAAVDTISKYGDFEWFVSDEPVPDVKKDYPPWAMPCGDEERTSCVGCKHLHDDQFHMDCRLGYDVIFEPEQSNNK